MEELGSSGSHFHGNLDPRAQEFRPLNPVNNLTQITVFTPPPQLFYPYAIPPPPPPLPLYPRNYFQLFPYSESGPGYYGSLQLIAPPHNPKGYVAEPNHPPPSVSPTRALVLSLLPAGVSESLLRRELEVYGEVRGVEMERINDGIVTVHFYDLRHAEMALNEINEVYMQQQSRITNPFNNSPYFTQNCCGGPVEVEFSGTCSSLQPRRREGLVAGRVIWAHFVVPASNAVPGGNNQGSLVVFNLDPDVPSHTLKQTFQAYGPVMEMRETPYKKNQKFVEFFDIRDAAKALEDLNGKVIYGHRIVIQFSRPGGLVKKFLNANQSSIPDPRSTFSNTTTLVNIPNGFRSSRYPPPLPPPPPPPKFSGRSSSSSRSPRSYNSRYQSVSKKGNPNVNKFSTEDSIPSLSLMNIGSTQREIPVVKRKNLNYHSSNKNHNDDHHSSRDSRPWRSKHSRPFDPRFLIQEDAPVDSNCKDSRTTVMIKNIPNKYSQKLLLNMLDNHCISSNEQLTSHGHGHDDDDQPLSSYDFVYLPIDFSNKCNVGYGFVNMTSPEATLRLYKAFHLQHWEVFNSRKICEVTYARVQGLEALKEHFKNSKFPCEVGHYLPVVFSPPRDGKQLTEPLPIVGYKQKQQQPITDNGETLEGEDAWGNGNVDDSCIECGSDHGGPDDERTGGSYSNTCTTTTCSSSIGCFQNDDDDQD